MIALPTSRTFINVVSLRFRYFVSCLSVYAFCVTVRKFRLFIPHYVNQTVKRQPHNFLNLFLALKGWGDWGHLRLVATKVTTNTLEITQELHVCFMPPPHSCPPVRDSVRTTSSWTSVSTHSCPKNTLLSNFTYF